MSEFVHLHCHTEYSLLDGAIRLNDLCARAKDFGMPAAAITDHGNLYGAAYFYTTCKSYGIKPVIGCEVYVTRDHRDKDSEFSRVRHHLILLAKNNEGYHNLVRLVSKGFLDGFHYKPSRKPLETRRTRAFWTASIISPAWIKPCSASTAKGSLRFPRALPVKSPAR